MACGCKKNASSSNGGVVKSTPVKQTAKPQKSNGGRIIKREIR